MTHSLAAYFLPFLLVRLSETTDEPPSIDSPLFHFSSHPTISHRKLGFLSNCQVACEFPTEDAFEQDRAMLSVACSGLSLQVVNQEHVCSLLSHVKRLSRPSSPSGCYATDVTVRRRIVQDGVFRAGLASALMVRAPSSHANCSIFVLTFGFKRPFTCLSQRTTVVTIQA